MTVSKIDENPVCKCFNSNCSDLERLSCVSANSMYFCVSIAWWDFQKLCAQLRIEESFEFFAIECVMGDNLVTKNCWLLGREFCDRKCDDDSCGEYFETKCATQNFCCLRWCCSSGVAFQRILPDLPTVVSDGVEVLIKLVAMLSFYIVLVTASNFDVRRCKIIPSTVCA